MMAFEVAAWVAAAGYVALTWLACGGLPKRRPRPVPVAVPVGRHARAWPRSRPVDPALTVAFMEREWPFLEWDEWTRPLRRVR